MARVFDVFKKGFESRIGTRACGERGGGELDRRIPDHPTSAAQEESVSEMGQTSDSEKKAEGCKMHRTTSHKVEAGLFGEGIRGPKDCRGGGNSGS